MTKHKNKGSGGARPNAGRKTANKKPHTIRVTDAEKKLIEEMRANKS